MSDSTRSRQRRAAEPSAWAPPSAAEARRRSAQAAAIVPPVQLQPHLALIDESHLRCAALGLSRIERPDHAPLARSDLGVVRERNQRLFVHAAPVMEMLFEQIAGSDSMIVLTDAQGTILYSVGDDDFLDRAGKVALAPGVSWAEHSKGTNAIGTALFAEAPTLVHADEHFMHANSFLTCSAAPIFDPRGGMLGVLDVSGDHRSHHQHTMGLVRMSARMIENQWLADDYSHRLRLHFHTRAEFIGTLLEGIVVVGADGRVLGANRSGLDQLGMSSAALRLQTLSSLFDVDAAALFDHFRVALAPPVPLHLPDGRLLHVHARFNAPARPVAAGGLPPQSLVAPDGAAAAGHAAASAAGNTPVDRATKGPVDGSTKAPEDARAAAPGRAAGHAAAVHGSALDRLVSGDAGFDAVLAKARCIIDRDIALLLIGEPGTGKQVLARALHADSSRAAQPFVVLECETLTERRLFDAALGGTVLLAHVGALSPGLQACLVPWLNGRGASTSVVATNPVDLRAEVAASRFREDLYLQLAGLVLRLPPLRERSDLERLAARLLQDAATPPQHAPSSPPATLLRLLRAHPWPGNLRQLARVLRTAAVIAGDGAIVDERHLSDDVADEARQALAARGAAATVVAAVMAPICEFAGPTPAPPAPGTAPVPSTASGAMPGPAGETLGEAEARMIRLALDAARGNVSLAARRLGISRNTVYRKLKR